MSFVPFDELKQLSGRKQPRKVCGWLSEREWVFEEGADGLPKVDQRYYDKRMTEGICDQMPEINTKALEAICGSKVQK